MVAAAIAISMLVQTVPPPFVRVWTNLTPESTRVLDVQNGRIWYASKSRVGMLDARSGKSLWEAKPSAWMHPYAVDQRSIYVVGQSVKQNVLYRIDRSTGATRALFTSNSGITAIDGDGTRAFALLESSTLRAFNVRTGRALWSRQLQPAGAAGRFGLASLLASGRYVHVGAENRRLCLDAASGKTMWSVNSQYAYNRPVLVGQQILVQDGSKLGRQDLATGKMIWQQPYDFEGFGISGHVLVGEQESSIIGVDGRNGALLWKRPGGEPGFTTGGDESLNLSSSEGVWVRSGKKLRLINASGLAKWDIEPPFGAMPCFADADTLICYENNRILAYRHGSLKLLPNRPSDRKALALSLVENYERLDLAERERIYELREYSFKPFLDKFVSWMLAFGAKSQREESSRLYDLIEGSKLLLLRSFDKKNSADVVAALKKIGPSNEWASIFENILEEKGDQSVYVPILIEKLKAGGSSGNLWESSTVEIVARSTMPQAVAFMIEGLGNPKANPELRQQAFRHLAGTGGEAGVAAVLAARCKPGPRAPWTELAKPEEGRRSPKPVTRPDARGHNWTLFSSPALGHYGDRFIVEPGGKPMFLGFFTGEIFGGSAPSKYRGYDIAKLVEGQWINVFPDDPEIRKDSDSDGLTDLVEARFGTDPHNSDTDGDGLGDSVDPCPNAAPRPLGDMEKIIAASVEARFFEEGWGTPAVIEAPGVKPFELYGYPRTLMWGESRRTAPLGSVYGGGVNLIGFQSPDEGGTELVKFGPDHKTATTMISRYSGGLNGDGTRVSLKKIGDEWFVTDMKIAYVS